MSKFAISDLHFGSENIIRHCNRPFKNADEAQGKMIQYWNSIVQGGDTVFVLGDFITGPAKTVPAILKALNGRIVLIRGNHETEKKLTIYRQFPEKISVKDIHYLPYKGLFFLMCHFPMTNEEFLKMVAKDYSEVVTLYGHVHNREPFFNEGTHAFNVSADAVGFIPVNLERIYNLVREHFVRLGVWREESLEEDD